jgi:hypothetical protein
VSTKSPCDSRRVSRRITQFCERGSSSRALKSAPRFFLETTRNRVGEETDTPIRRRGILCIAYNYRDLAPLMLSSAR